MKPPSVDELIDEPVKARRPCALCEREPGIWLVFGGRYFGDECVDAWRKSDRWPEDRMSGSFVPVFEAWFAEKKAEFKRGAA